MIERARLQNLVAKAQNGDRLAFQDLFEGTHTAIFNFLRALGLTRDEADDLCQETYIRVWNALPRLKSPESFVAWLHQIARNVAKDYRKHRGRHPEVNTDVIDQNQGEIGLAPEQTAEEQMVKSAVMSAISSLPDNQRLPIVMHHVDGLEISEIAKILKISYGTVLSRLARGRAVIAKRLAPMIDLPSPPKEKTNVL